MSKMFESIDQAIEHYSLTVMEGQHYYMPDHPLIEREVAEKRQLIEWLEELKMREPMDMNETKNGFYCPSCEMKLVGKTHSGYPCAKIDMPNDEPVKFCPRCGQAVKWE